jgi:hypothetical protein
MALAEHRDELEPLDFDVAGPSVIFLVIDIFVYWIVIILFENNVFGYLKEHVFCKR